MNWDELPGWWDAKIDRVRPAVSDAATAMGQTFQRDVVGSMRGPAPSPRGTPPARRTGTLARSVRATRAAVTGVVARVSVAPHTVYARIQQLGGDIYPVRAKALHWGGTPFGPLPKGVKRSRGIFAMHVHMPKRPYMDVTPERARAARRAGKNAFMRAMGWK